MKKKASSNADTAEETLAYDDAHEEVTVESAEGAVEKGGNIISQAVYTSVYAVSFGVVFSSLLVSRLLVPKDSTVAKALHDGSVAAKKAIEEKEQLIVEVAEETAEILSGDAPAAVAL